MEDFERNIPLWTRDENVRASWTVRLRKRLNAEFGQRFVVAKDSDQDPEMDLRANGNR